MTEIEKLEKVIRDGKVAVLISHGFGTGWYSWYRDEQLLFSPKIVEMVEQGKADQIDEDWIKENLGIKVLYCGGASDLKIYWLPIGTKFQVEQDNGAEILITMDDLCIVA